MVKYRPKFLIIEIYDYLAEDIQKLMDDSGYELIECLQDIIKKTIRIGMVLTMIIYLRHYENFDADWHTP